MIRINLLGKKKVAAAPFALDEKLEKIGVKPGDLLEFRSTFFKIVFIWAGLYAASYVPTHLHDERVRVLDAELATLTTKSADLQKELATKKDIRKQMEQLNKEESELQRQLNAVNALQQGRGMAFITLNDLVNQLEKSKKVWIDDVKLDDRKVILNGKSWEYIPINDFVKSITESTRYGNVLFKEIITEPSTMKPVPGVPESAMKIKRFGLEFSVKEGQ